MNKVTLWNLTKMNNRLNNQIMQLSQENRCTAFAEPQTRPTWYAAITARSGTTSGAWASSRTRSPSTTASPTTAPTARSACNHPPAKASSKSNLRTPGTNKTRKATRVTQSWRRWPTPIRSSRQIEKWLMIALIKCAKTSLLPSKNKSRAP